MERVEFIEKLYNGKNCYSDFMTNDEMDILRINSKIDELLERWLFDNKIIFLTGNPGDGKTYIIKSHQRTIDSKSIFVEKDINSLNESQMEELIQTINKCYIENKACIIAANEYPFLSLQKNIKDINRNLYDEIIECKKHNVIFGNDHYNPKRCIVVDLNERNLLDSQNNRLFIDLLDKTSNYLKQTNSTNSILIDNIKRLSNSNVKSRITGLVNLVACNGQHFVVRDILGFIAFLFTSSDLNNNKLLYFDAIFDNNSDNTILQEIIKFDPTKITNPELDEKLWNGDIKDNWEIDVPNKWPFEYNDIFDAIQCFKSIKRKYYFENGNASLDSFVDERYLKILDMLKHPERKSNIETIILAINNMFSSGEDKQSLYIWTTNRYDLSIDYKAAVCSKSIYKDKFELLIPKMDNWLEGSEFVPSFLLFRLKNDHNIYIKLDIEFLTILLKVNDGYPSGLIGSQFEQTLNSFMRKLENCNECNEDVRVYISNRKNNDRLEIEIDDIDSKIKINDR